MRVTNSMVTNQVIYNTQRAMKRYMDLQTSMSSGRRINTPSDDPLGTQRDLDYRTELSKIEQYQNNISLAQSWMSTYDSVLSDVKDLVSEAKEIALTMANDTYDETARVASANEIKSIFEQLIQLGNTQIDGRYMFSGYKTKTESFEATSDGVVFQGDSGEIKFEIESSIYQTVNLSGLDSFMHSFNVLGQDSDFNIGLTDDTLLSDLNGGEGIDLTTGTFTITDLNLVGTSVTIDLNTVPPATTVGEAITKINDQLTAAGITNLSMSISEVGNCLALTTTQTGEISTATELTRLNNGTGVDLEPGQIKVVDGSGAETFIDLSSAKTIGDVITAFNTQIAAAGYANVTMDVNATGTGLVINDTNPVPLDLTIENISDSKQTASQLGIAGFVGASLVGRDLEPQVSFEIAETTGTTAADLGIFGDYTSDASGTDIDPALLLTSRLADLNNGFGLGDDEIVMWQGERSFTVDFGDPSLITVQDLLDQINNSGLDITASINDSGRGIQIANNDSSRSFTVEDVSDGRAARNMGLYGSSDMLGSILVLHKALENDDREGIEMMVGNFDEAITLALENRASVGSTVQRLDSTENRLVNLNLSFTELLSEVEDADLTEVVTDLALYETSYQAALQSAALIIQPSLLDFLT